MVTKNLQYLSHFIHEDTPGYGGQSGFLREHATQICCGRSANSQNWRIYNHIGTHIDLPYHFDERGLQMQDYEAKDWFFEQIHLINYETEKKELIDLTHQREKIPLDCDFLIIKTGFEKYRSEKTYWQSNPGLAPEFAKWLRLERPSLRAVGFDFISVTSFAHRKKGKEAHQHLLHHTHKTSPIWAVEDMKLSSLEKSPSKVTIAPVLIRNADGSPVTIFAEL